MSEAKQFDAQTFLNGLASYKAKESGRRPIRAVLVDFLKQPAVRKEVETALKSRFSRRALMEVLSEQHKVSLPTLRRALDEVFPKKDGGTPAISTVPSARQPVATKQRDAAPIFTAASGHAGFDEEPR